MGNTRDAAKASDGSLHSGRWTSCPLVRSGRGQELAERRPELGGSYGLVQHDVAVVFSLTKDVDLDVTGHHQGGDVAATRTAHIGDGLQTTRAVTEAQIGDDQIGR